MFNQLYSFENIPFALLETKPSKKALNIFVTSQTTIPLFDADLQYLALETNLSYEKSKKEVYKDVVTDRKFGIALSGSTISYYVADIVSAMDYDPYGMALVGRTWNRDAYRFGFNGQEYDGELGDIWAAEFWEYDASIGRRWNIDPKGKVWESPYRTFDGNPILVADPKGDEGTLEVDKKTGKGKVKAKIFLKKAEDLKGVDSKDTEKFRENVKANIIKEWTEIARKQGVTLDADSWKEFDVQWAGVMQTDAEMTGENMTLITVGRSQGKGHEYDDMYKISHIDGAKGKTGFFYFGAAGEEVAAHEFGHIVGLTDRYVQGEVLQELKNVGGKYSKSNMDSPHGYQYELGKISIQVDEEGYDPYDNLMSNGKATLTKAQWDIVTSPSAKEAIYPGTGGKDLTFHINGVTLSKIIGGVNKFVFKNGSIVDKNGAPASEFKKGTYPNWSRWDEVVKKYKKTETLFHPYKDDE